MRPVRQIRIDGDVVYIPLTRGKVAVIDAEDAHLVEGRNWCAVPGRKTFYAMGVEPRVDGRQVKVRMHRVVLGVSDDVGVDHRDGDGLNCRKRNLRTATDAQNSSNRTMRSDNRTGHKGVSWDARKKLWKAMITVNGRKHYLGRFKEISRAAAAYKRASEKYHGEFRRETP